MMKANAEKNTKGEKRGKEKGGKALRRSTRDYSAQTPSPFDTN